MNPKIKWLLVVCVLTVFAATAVVGINFIMSVERSASDINTQVPSNKPHLPMNDLSLSPSSSAVGSGADNMNFAVNPALNAATSEGNDVAIVRGEFAYRAGAPDVQIVLKNQGRFPIKAIHVNAILRLNGKPDNVAQDVAIPIVLPQILYADETVRVDVPVAHDAWVSETVAQAQSRQVLVQVVSVSGGEEEDMDYPQIGDAVLLKQIVNDWKMPRHQINEPSEKAVPPETESPQNDDDETPPPPADSEDVDVVKRILDEQKLPETNDTGVISYQEKTFKK